MMRDIYCAFFGHQFALGAPEPLTYSRFWHCDRCHVCAGLERQHHGRPNRFLFTIWRTRAESLVSIYRREGLNRP